MTLPERPGSTRSRPPVRRTRRPPASCGPDGTARGDGQSAIDLGQRRWVLAVARLAQPPPQRPARQRPVRPRHGAGVGRVGQQLRRPALRAAPPRRAARRPAGPAAGPDRAPRSRAHRGSSSWRTRLRTNAGSSLLSSHTGARPAAAQTAWVSLRRRASSGCRVPGSMPASPSAPAPRRRFTRIVSAWSSMVCPVATSAGSTREARRPGAGLEIRSRRHRQPMAGEARPEARGRRRHHLRLCGGTGPQAVVHMDRGDVAARRRRRGRGGRGSRHPPTPRRPARLPPAGTCTGSGGRETRVVGRGAALLSHRLGPPRPPGRGSPPAWAATRAPPTPGPAGPARRTPRPTPRSARPRRTDASWRPGRAAST